MSERPSGNGNALRDYQIKELQDIARGQDKRLRVVEDTLLQQRSGGVTLKQLLTTITVVFTALGAAVAAFYQLLLK